MRKIIRFFCFLLSVIFCITAFSSFAYASVFPSQTVAQRFGAWMFSALTALNIAMYPVKAATIDALNFLSEPFRIVEQVVQPVPYTDQWASDFFDRSTLSIQGDVVTIDGVDYYDIWLSHDAANKFRVNAFDIENAWDIASESEGTFVSGVGLADGVPLFDFGGTVRSQTYTFPNAEGSWSMGDIVVENYKFANINNSRQTLSNGNNAVRRDWAISGYVYKSGNSYISQLEGPQNSILSIPHALLDLTPFEFDWVSGTIPAEPLGEDDGLHLYVPADPDQWDDKPDVKQTIDDVQQFFQDNPEIGPGHSSPMVDPDLHTKIDDLIDLIIPIIPFIEMQFGPEGQAPVPVDPVEPDPQPEPFPDPQPVPVPFPDPEPGTTISDTDWKSLFDWLKNIFQRLASIDVSSQTISNVVTEMRNKFEYWFDDLRTNIQNGVRDIINSISTIPSTISQGVQDIISSISSLGDTILQDIETGPIIRIQRGLDKIKQIFLPVLIPLKAALGIWHYVVEWLEAITYPFRWILDIAIYGYSDILIPIYACIAGTLCIAVYRKFGR